MSGEAQKAANMAVALAIFLDLATVGAAFLVGSFLFAALVAS